MRLRTVVEREGELLGPVDWSYDFDGMHQTFMNCSPKGVRLAELLKRVESLRELERLHREGNAMQFRDGDYWRDVVAVGMYDGWPYWQPTPAICRRETVIGGVTWNFWYDIHDIRIKP